MEHNVNISKYNPLAGSNSVKLPKEFDNPRKGLIDVQNIDDNEALNGVYSDTYILQTII